jgi:outer membrane lipase/esterase
MKLRMFRALLAAVCIAASPAALADFSSVVIFGDSLSDTGNNAFVFDAVGATQSLPPGTLRTPVPTSDNTFIPELPYPTPVGGRYSNGPVWAEDFASALGLSAIASNLGGTDYAYGGARMGPLGSPNPFLDFPNNFPLSVTTQVATFLGQHPQAPADALYIVEGGGNDARDIIQEAAQDIAGSIDPGPDIMAGAKTYANYVNNIVDELQAAGAKNIIVWNTPDVGLAPAVAGTVGSALGTSVANQMNWQLAMDLKDEVKQGDVRIFDVFDLVDTILADPEHYGLSPDITDACSAAANVTACEAANFDYFFWDGIHPTAAGQALFAEAMVTFVPEPSGFALLALALAAMGIARHRSRLS